MFPSLEIGYLVVPLSLLESFSKAKEILGGSPCAIDQATLAHFLLEGHFDRHVHRMNAIYYQRLQALSQAVIRSLTVISTSNPQPRAPRGGPVGSRAG